MANILTEEQKQIVTDNHSLIYGFLNKHNLDVEEYYGLCAIGLCNAVKTLNSQKSKLGTYAYKCMENEIKQSARANYSDKRKANINTVSIIRQTQNGTEYYITDDEPDKNNFEKSSIFKLQILKKMHILSYPEKMMVNKYLAGYTVKDICNETGQTHQYIYQVNKRLRKKLADIKE